MTIVTVAGSVSLYVGVNDILENHYPTDIEINVWDFEYNTLPNRNDIYNTIQDTLKEKNQTMFDFIQYNALQIGVVKNENGISIQNSNTESQSDDTTNSADLTLITLDDYNSITKGNQTLNDNEILMFANGYDIPKTFNIDSTQYSVKPINDFHIDNIGYYSINGISEICVVLKDKSQLEDIYNRQLESNCFSNFYYYVGFNLSGTDNEKISIYEDLTYQFTSDNYDNPYLKNDYKISVMCRQSNKSRFYELYGSLLFLGIFLGVTFLMATGLIIYYKQLSEGYDDKQRFDIMQKVGLSKDEVKKTIHTQILMVFFLPLITAIIHTAFAFPMIKLLLQCFALYNVRLFLICTSLVVIIFGAIYTLTYSITAKIYFKITTE